MKSFLDSYQCIIHLCVTLTKSHCNIMTSLLIVIYKNLNEHELSVLNPLVQEITCSINSVQHLQYCRCYVLSVLPILCQFFRSMSNILPVVLGVYGLWRVFISFYIICHSRYLSKTFTIS